MNTVLLALMGPAAIGVVMGTAIAWDRLREPHRDPTKPFAVTDRRTYRDGQRRLAKLIDAEDILHAEFVMEAMRQWLRHELHTGRRSRKAWCASQLEQLELHREQLTGRPATI
jgi:hypothetical protein